MFVFLNASAAKGEPSVFGGEKGYPPFLLQSMQSWISEMQFMQSSCPTQQRMMHDICALLRQCDNTLQQQVLSGQSATPQMTSKSHAEQQPSMMGSMMLFQSMQQQQQQQPNNHQQHHQQPQLQQELFANEQQQLRQQEAALRKQKELHQARQQMEYEQQQMAAQQSQLFAQAKLAMSADPSRLQVRREPDPW